MKYINSGFGAQWKSYNDVPTKTCTKFDSMASHAAMVIFLEDKIKKRLKADIPQALEE